MVSVFSIYRWEKSSLGKLNGTTLWQMPGEEPAIQTQECWATRSGPSEKPQVPRWDGMWKLSPVFLLFVFKSSHPITSPKEAQNREHLIEIKWGVPIVARWKWIWLVSMRLRVWSLASLRGLWIWHCCELWCRLAATAPIRPLAWESPYAMGAALKKAKRKKERGINTFINQPQISIPPW